MSKINVEVDAKSLEELERQYDTALATRPLSTWLSRFVFVFSIGFAAYHYITAGIRVPVGY